MKILIVDDNRDDRKLLQLMIQRNGHEAIEAEDGFDGLKRAKAAVPDLIISDALMPVMDGFQFLREVKQDPALRPVPFIFYSSSYKDYQDVRLAMSLGADAYIIKPVDPVELWGRIATLLQEGEQKKAPPVPLIRGDTEYLKRYSEVVATKLEEKVRELERTLEDRKRAEDALREREAFIKNILETVDEGFIVVDRSYRILSANKSYCLQAGLRQDEVVGRPCYEVSHHHQRPCHEEGERCAVRQTFETGEPATVEHTHLDASGSKRYTEIRSYPLLDASGGLNTAIETISDVTERKKLEEQLRHAQKLEALGTLAGGVAHDFNNILSVLVGYGAMMEMRMGKDDPNLPYLREMRNAMDRAAHLTQALLIFGRKQITELKPLDINELVSGMRKMVLRLIGEDIETKIELAPEKLPVMGDYGQLEQVLMNFATNARDAMPDGGVLTLATGRVEADEEFVRLHGFEKEGDYAVISASDTGQGMDQRTRERIFEPFFTTKAIGKGTGLGLAIVYGIIQQHHGHITCYSEPGKGTIFKAYFPLLKEEMIDAGLKEQPPLAGGAETLLIADDDANVRAMTRGLLEKFGYTIIEAEDGADAVEKFREHRDRIGLVLLDVIMPKKSGRDAYKEMRALQPRVKAVFVSGYSDDVVQRKGIAGQHLPLLQKPFSPRDVLTVIREALDRKQDDPDTQGRPAGN